MARIKIQEPVTYTFSTNIPVRISDINYGNHVGNDAILSIIHEARMQFLNQFGFTELDCGGVGLIMADAGIEFKKELFYGDDLTVHVTTEHLSSIGFDLYYKLEKKKADKTETVALAKTGMICYNYSLKKIAQVPGVVKEKIQPPRKSDI
jgi:acyl-CoA thioester hydrolase